MFAIRPPLSDAISKSFQIWNKKLDQSFERWSRELDAATEEATQAIKAVKKTIEELEKLANLPLDAHKFQQLREVRDTFAKTGSSMASLLAECTRNIFIHKNLDRLYPGCPQLYRDPLNQMSQRYKTIGNTLALDFIPDLLSLNHKTVDGKLKAEDGDAFTTAYFDCWGELHKYCKIMDAPRS